MCAFWNMIVRSGVFIKSLMNIRTIKVNIRWYKEVISLRGDFFVCKSRKSFIYKGVRLFLFLWSVLCCPWKPSRNCLLLCTGFQRRLFWNLLLPWGFTQNIKSCTGSRLYSWRMEHKINLKRHTAVELCALRLISLNETLDDGCNAI